MAITLTETIKDFVKYYVEKVDFEYDEDNSVNMTTTYWSLLTKNTSTGLAPDFDDTKWTLIEEVPTEASKLKEVSIEDSKTHKVTEMLVYYYEWYTEEEPVIEHVSGVCVTCVHHTTENPYFAEMFLKKKHRYVCEGQQVVLQKKNPHYCKAYVTKDYIEGKDVYACCSDYNFFGECTKYEKIVSEKNQKENQEEAIPVPVIRQDGNIISITAEMTAGDSILYTVDGSNPKQGEEYIGSFEIDKNTTVMAVVKRNGVYSDIAAKECVCEEAPQPEQPVISVTDNIVSITAEDAEKIYYTTDGREPTTESTEYTEAFSITETVVVKAIAIKGDTVSKVAEVECEFVEP